MFPSLSAESSAKHISVHSFMLVLLALPIADSGRPAKKTKLLVFWGVDSDGGQCQTLLHYRLLNGTTIADLLLEGSLMASQRTRVEE